MISIAMTTYNGEIYIKEQLDSIRNQILPADEVVICDDRSTDKTYDILLEYKDRWNLDHWKIIKNESNLGWKKNFYKALSKTQGDIVFFSDQDDVWNEKKVQIMTSRMQDKNIEVLCCTTNIINSNGENVKVSKSSIPSVRSGRQDMIKNSVDYRFTYSIMPGCAMAIKRVLINRLDALLDFGSYCDIPHDALFWKIASLRESAYILNMDLISYRVHMSNASSPQLRSSYNRKAVNIRKEENNTYLCQVTNVLDIYEKLGARKYTNLLRSIIEFLDERNHIIDKKDIITALRNIKYYRSFKMLCGDILTGH